MYPADPFGSELNHKDCWNPAMTSNDNLGARARVCIVFGDHEGTESVAVANHRASVFAAMRFSH